jgi:glycosyltransferase involved in cell wall biosynthesis
MSQYEVKPTVSVVVPALNEEGSIGWVMDHIPDWVHEVILVDGLSTDRTEQVVLEHRPDAVMVRQLRRGKGAALRAGFAAATGEIIVMIDADGSTDPREMQRYINALVAGADFVKGSRNLPGGGSMDFTLLRHLGNLGFVWAANILFRQRFSDLCYGYCAFWKRDLDMLGLTADGFEIEMELILSAIKANLSIVEVPSMELPRRFGESNLNAWKDGKRVLRTLLRERFARQVRD